MEVRTEYNGGNGYYSNPWDIFNYYFGNQG